MVICKDEEIEAITKFIGRKSDYEWQNEDTPMISRRILVTKSEINGKRLKNLHLSNLYNITITRVNRSGVDLYADPNLELQIGDRVTTVGKKDDVEHVANILGNELKRLDHPNIVTIFVGIFLGIFLVFAS